MELLLVNEMKQELPLLDENFIRLLQFAQKHGWVPTGPLDLWSSHPSLNDYLPTGRELARCIDPKDAKEISLALRSGMKDLVSMHGDLLAYGDDPDVISAQKEPRDQMEELVKFFQRGYVVVFRWKD